MEWTLQIVSNEENWWMKIPINFNQKEKKKSNHLNHCREKGIFSLSIQWCHWRLCYLTFLVSFKNLFKYKKCCELTQDASSTISLHISPIAMNDEPNYKRNNLQALKLCLILLWSSKVTHKLVHVTLPQRISFNI